MNNDISIGDRITSCRTAKGLTQEGLAQAMGISQAALSRWESNQREPQLRYLYPLATALGVTVESLLPGTHPIEPALHTQHIRSLLTQLRATANQLEQLIT